MGDIIDLHERLTALEFAHNNLVKLLKEKEIVPKEDGDRK